MDHPKRVAIIGAGPSGLASIKSCKEEGIEPFCFERSGHAGGLWTYHDDDVEGISSVMKNTIMNTGKEMTAFSDFPPPKDFPNFMHHTIMQKYLMLYAEEFDLLRHIRYYSEVIKVEPTKDYDDTGRWVVSVRNSKTGQTTKEEYDGVMVCIGHHVYPKMPTFPGQEKFQGLILHSHSVKSGDQFSGKKVVVVGIGNSGADVAVDSSSEAEKVYLSTRKGSWIFSRIGINGRPYDMDFASRWKILKRPFISLDSLSDEIENSLNQRFDHEVYQLKPKHRVLSAHPTLNDYLPYCIVSGRVVVKGDIKRFEENGVVFVGEEETTEVDTVIMATGYIIKFPFLGDIVKTEDNYVELYKYAIPPALKHHTLAIIGLVQPVGSIDPVSEMQSRWFLQIFKGNVKLPSTREMLKDIKDKADHNAKMLVDSSRHTIEVDWIPFMDELATQIGVKPNFLKMALTDPKLFQTCFFGPCLPYQFRLEGPHAWAEARDTLLSYEERVFTPLNANSKAISKNQYSDSKNIRLGVLLLSGIDIIITKVQILYRITAFTFKIPFYICKKIRPKLSLD